ncbi:MAG: cob(I)yrinic acid a,c-diamide adenosyltransferase [Calditrichaeota bacterium]|nr:cob(I)yrinic acid a,c-diamide adenosyltransferase [Calditrichota bacterium]
MKIYTKTGDKGETTLLRGGRVSKGSLRIQTCGAVDELNSVIGWIRSQDVMADIDDRLERVQRDLFVIGADLTAPMESVKQNNEVLRLAEGSQTFLEHSIDLLDAQLPALKHFILPGGTSVATALHIARAVCRRAECLVVELTGVNKINPAIMVYLNRLSDYLFVAARYANFSAGREDVKWQEPE